MQRKKNKQEIPKTPLRFIVYASREYKWLALSAITIVSVAAVLGQLINYILKLLIDAAEVGNTQLVVYLAIAYPIAHLIVQGLYRVSGYIGASLTTNLKKKGTDILIGHLLKHSHTYFINRFSGSLLSKVGSVAGGADKFLPDLLWTFIPGVLSFVVMAYVVFNADIISGMLFIALLVVLIIINRFFSKKKRALAYAGSAAGTKMRGVIVDVLSNISAVRQYSRAKSEYERIGDSSDDWRQKSVESWRYSELMLTVNMLAIFLFGIGMFYFLVMRWEDGSIGTGDLVFIIALFSQILGSLMFIGRAFNGVAQTFGEMSEGLEEILEPIELIDTSNAQKLVANGGEIKWDDVIFSYEGVTVFDGFNLTIEPGQRVGLVGQSGAGKTTFVSLLLRQHDIDSGSVRIDGKDITGVTQDSLRENIAVVPQEPMLFHRSIRENIAYGKPKATKKEIEAVAKNAEAHEFVATLPQGYETLVGERGVKLSGGQKQRIAIARAMLKDAPILVLDEATSALDSESEVAIQKALHKLMEGKTVIAIAHRLSTLREMDRIIVLDTGKIVEDGNHDELVKNGEIYARLWKHQAGGFLVE